MALCEATGKEGNEDKCLKCCCGRYLTAPSSPSSWVLTQPLQATEEEGRRGATHSLWEAGFADEPVIAKAL